eukprot:TRINITY_DN6511_c0_g1_i1.p1 TRINITY_DN6511_c0_g1~~TRINITY_DN6511_c0_g1_i1.p1  ORF type:complete len:222 (-),score=19.03 TRINITY_DN6511_c0_g1_i1:266-883(-)
MESGHPLTASWESLSSSCSEEEEWATAKPPQVFAPGDAVSQSMSDSWCDVESDAAAELSVTGDDFTLVDDGEDARSTNALSWSVVSGQDDVMSFTTTPLTTPRADGAAVPAPMRNFRQHLPQHVVLAHVFGVPAMNHITQPHFPPANVVQHLPKASRHLPNRAQVPSQVSPAMIRRTGHLSQPKGRFRPGHKQCKVGPRQRASNQ